jgi:hypothetical protein
MHSVDVLYIDGLPGAQAIVLNGVLLAACGEGVGDFLTAPREFFAELGELTGTSFHVTEHLLSYDLPQDWEWPEVVARFHADPEIIAARIVAEHGNDWEDGYTAEAADEVLEEINALVDAAGLPGQIVLVWETVAPWGPGGSSDLYYVEPGGRIVHAGEAYQLVDGERDPRPFLALLDTIRAGEAETLPQLDHFPAIEVTDSKYQGVDGRLF